jgi:5-methylcytosine-specific restriction endonuclease McrA
MNNYYYFRENPDKTPRQAVKELGITIGLANQLYKIAFPKKKKPIRQVSKKMASRLQLYAAAKGAHLKKYPCCQVCGNEQSPSIHHIAGRAGNLLYNSENLITLCMSGSYYLSDKYPESQRTEGCHQWVERNLKIARLIGLSKKK